MRESGPAFFSSLVFHSVAMGFVVGVHVATNLRILGVARRVPLTLMRRFFSVLWVNLVIVSVSGVLLLAAYPAKALTNPVFYFKLVAVLAALGITRAMTMRPCPRRPGGWRPCHSCSGRPLSRRAVCWPIRTI